MGAPLLKEKPRLEEIEEWWHYCKSSNDGAIYMERGINCIANYYFRRFSNAFFIPGADEGDLKSIILLGAIEAWRDYNPKKGVSLGVFAYWCIGREIITALKTAQRKKHSVLNNCSSLDELAFEESKETIIDFTKGYEPDPLTAVIMQETVEEVQTKLKEKLSELEYSILTSHLSGKSYCEIAEELDCTIKKVDNTLSRIRKRKLHRILPSYQEIQYK